MKQAVIRTSDRIAFKSCRRKWDFSSHLRQNRQQKVVAEPLWLGSGIHFALEDFHGMNVYGDPATAFQAYAVAVLKYNSGAVFDRSEEVIALGTNMMEYYSTWLADRPPLDTFVYDGVPQVEVNIKIPIPFELLAQVDAERTRRIERVYESIHYSMQLDRVAIDAYGGLWIVEYKTAKQFQTSHFGLDPQVSTYVWGADTIYNQPIEGVIYQQHRKALAHPPKKLKNGSISVAANQATTYKLYRQSLLDAYGAVQAAPEANIKYLNTLIREETVDADAFIRRDKLFRNTTTSANVARYVLSEVLDMLDPDLLLYPNPTRECSRMCSFTTLCHNMEDGSDWKSALEVETCMRPETYDGWRSLLPAPDTFKKLAVATEKDLEISLEEV